MKSHSPDYILLATSFFLIFLGFLILSSASSSYSEERFGSTFYFLSHQIIYGLIPGIILGIIVYKLPLNFFKKYGLLLFLINLLLLGLVFIPGLGLKISGASRWLKIGTFSFQPSEFLKVTFMLYLSAWLITLKEKKTKKSSQKFIAFSIIIGLVSLFLILQPDISTLGIIISIAILMYFISDTPLWHTALIVLTGIILLALLIKFTPYRMSRITVFLNPETDPMGKGYQIKQALIATGSGRISGLGLGMSRQKYGFLPQAISDTIFVILAEEMGFIGASILVLLFLIFLWRGFTIAKKSQDKFSQLLAVGITYWITIQAFINMAAMIKILPLTGVPLPFISYGGSALISEMAALGILLNISKNTG